MNEISISNADKYLKDPGDEASIRIAKNGAVVSKLKTKDFKYSKITYKTGTEVQHHSNKKRK